MNLAWLGFFTQLASIVVQKNGNAPKELAYLSVLTNLVALTAKTDADLTELLHKYEKEVADGTETDVEEIDAIIARIEARGARIQDG